MSAISVIEIDTWYDFPFSQLVTILLKSGLRWNARDDDGNMMCSFAYYDGPMNMRHWDACPLSEQRVLFDDLDERSRNGTTVVACLMIGDDEKWKDLDFKKVGPEKFYVYLGVPERVAGTWLTDFSPYIEKLVAPLVKHGIKIRDVRYENGY